MARILLAYQSEGASLLERDLTAFGFEVVTRQILEVDALFEEHGVDAMVLEAPARAEELRSLLENPARAGRSPLLLLVRPDQLAAHRPACPWTTSCSCP